MLVVSHDYRFIIAFDWYKAFQQIPEILGSMLKRCESCEWRPNGVRVMTFDVANRSYHGAMEDTLFNIGVPFTSSFEIGEA